MDLRHSLGQLSGDFQDMLVDALHLCYTQPSRVSSPTGSVCVLLLLLLLQVWLLQHHTQAHRQPQAFP
jgi:hypothetical protein